MKSKDVKTQWSEKIMSLFTFIVILMIVPNSGMAVTMDIGS